MKRALFTACLAIMTVAAADIPPSLSAAPAPKLFEGKWVLDKKASPSVKVAPAALVQQFKQEGDKLIVRSVYQQPKDGMYPVFWLGVMTDELELQPDGSELTTGIGPYRYVSKTRQEGNKLITDWVAELANGDVKAEGKVEGTWVRTVSEDGREMTMEMNGKCSDGRQMQATLVFHKK